MKSFIFGFLCASALFMALHYQFIRTSDDVIVARKPELGFVNTYIDTTQWSAGDYLKNPAVTATLAARGLGKAIDEIVGSLPKPEAQGG